MLEVRSLPEQLAPGDRTLLAIGPAHIHMKETRTEAIAGIARGDEDAYLGASYVPDDSTTRHNYASGGRNLLDAPPRRA
jgi:hypothetical protein